MPSATNLIAPPHLSGMVFCTVDEAALTGAAINLLCGMRTVHHFTRLHAVIHLPQVQPSGLNPSIAPLASSESLTRLCKLMSNDTASFPPIALPDVPSFRVCCDRVGTHSFRSVDVERCVGEVIHEATGVPGCMSAPHTIIRITILGPHVIIGTQLHGLIDGHRYSLSHTFSGDAFNPPPSPPFSSVLSKRLHGAFIRDASLKPNVAAAMIIMSRMQPGMTLIDPFVGSGTIVLEAAMMFSSGRFIGVERSERVVQGARDNARGLELEGRVELLAGNARVLKELTGSGTADVIVTNPPWGVRLGKCDDIDELYRGFLQSAADVL
jgi:tRNA (guanine6-N2)-methyltransferase